MTMLMFEPMGNLIEFLSVFICQFESSELKLNWKITLLKTVFN